MRPRNSSTDIREISAHANALVCEDLKTLAATRHYRSWVYAQIQPVLGKRIIEIGSGLGNYTPYLRKHGVVWATDSDPAYVDFLARRFKSDKEQVTIGHLALGAWDSITRENVRAFRADTIVCLNVLEHVENDAVAVAAMSHCLQHGGAIALVVPAMPSLFCSLDRCYGHFRRYSPDDMLRLTELCEGVCVARCRYFNAVGVLGWWLNHVVMQRKKLPQLQVRVFDQVIVPMARVLERVVRPPRGLSLAIWLKKL